MAEEKKAEKKDRFKLAKEFKAFISRGNVLDMAVGLIIGSAFTAIVNSLVGDLLMPLLGLLTGKMDFSQLKLVLQPAVEEVLDETGAVVTPAVAEISLNYGSYIQSVISFLLNITTNKQPQPQQPANPPPQADQQKPQADTKKDEVKKEEVKKEEEPKPEPKPDPQIVLLTEIRDLLKEKETSVDK